MKKFLVLTLLWTLGGCFSSTPNSKFYLLESSERIGTVSDHKINLSVQDIFVPEYADRPQITLQKPDSAELSVAEFHRWASDLNTMMQNTLIDNLQKALPRAEIKPLAFGNNSRYVIKVNIEKMGGWLGAKAYMSGSWQILNPRGRVVYEQNFARTRAAGKTYDSYVQAQSGMWGDVAGEIAAKVSSLK